MSPVALFTPPFPSGLLGTASFVVLDTDYDARGLVCTCQSTKIFFDVLTFHRRSCTILQRRPVPDAEISKKVGHSFTLSSYISNAPASILQLYALLDDAIPAEDGEPAHHDFDAIGHANCDYSDDDKGLRIDVDKIIGATQSEVGRN